MNKAPKFAFILAITLIALLSACAKDETTPSNPNGSSPTPITYGDFRWTVNGTTTVSDSAICYLQITTLYAYKSGTLSTVELNLSDVVTGTYPINLTSGNELKYVNGSTNLSASTGTVNITGNTGSKITGNFIGLFAGSTNSISGNFTDVKFR